MAEETGVEGVPGVTAEQAPRGRFADLVERLNPPAAVAEVAVEPVDPIVETITSAITALSAAQDVAWCRENAAAIEDLRAALGDLGERERNRKARAEVA